MESVIQMNKFETVEMPGMITVAFLIAKDYEAYSQGYSLLSLEKIRSTEIEEDGQKKKIFSVIVDSPDQVDDVVLLILTDNKAYLSTGVLDKTGYTAKERDISLNYGSIFNIEGIEYKEVSYTPDMRRNFSIIDTQTGEEVKPSLFRDPVTGEVKGRCKIMPNRTYIVIELNLSEN